MKCDEKEAVAAKLFEPESPNVIVCEGFHDAGLVEALLRHLAIDNCDVTYPKKTDGGNGESGIKTYIELLAGRYRTINGLMIVTDADENPAAKFKGISEAFCKLFVAPPKPFTIHRAKERKTGVFLTPGEGKTGELEHLLLEVISADHPDTMRCIEAFRQCPDTANSMAGWPENKHAKMKMACYIASHCKNDPCCSLGFIWSSKNRALNIGSSVFAELSALLKEFSSDSPDEKQTRTL